MKKIGLNKWAVLILAPVFILICCMFICKDSEAESTGDKIDDVVAYESVLVCKGDTLWSIAEANLEQPTEAEISAFVDEIASVNRISSANIHAGNYILVPRYKSC